jgi:hypothetical protein
MRIRLLAGGNTRFSDPPDVDSGRTFSGKLRKP